MEKPDVVHQVWVFRTPSEKWKTECIAPNKKGKGVSVMVWDCFLGKNRGTFCPFVVKSVNARVYLKLLEYLFLLVVQYINDTIGDAVFQQDIILHQLLLNGLSGTIFRLTNTLPTHRTSILSNMSG